MPFLGNMILSIIRSRSVNMQKVAESIEGKADPSSNYRRIQRLFKDQDIDYNVTAQLLSTLLPSDNSWVLTIDRTNWKLGKSNINILVLAVCYDGVAIPLFWEFLTLDESDDTEKTGKRGNSNTAERKDLLSRFIAVFGTEKIKAIVGDREFIGEKWFSWLCEQKIPFIMRIRNNTPLEDGRKALSLFDEFPKETFKVIENQALFSGIYHIGHVEVETAKEPLMILISSGLEKESLSIYKQRWEIETLFGFLKSKGLNLEESKISEKEKIEKLMALLSLSFLWAMMAGDFKEAQKATPLKKNSIPYKKSI